MILFFARCVCYGRAKRAPYWAVQSRFRVIYCIYVCQFVYVCLWETNTTKSYAKMNGQNYVVQARACSKSVLGVSLNQNADYNFHLESLILPSSGQLKLTCDTCISHFYYTLEQLYSMDKKETEKTFT